MGKIRIEVWEEIDYYTWAGCLRGEIRNSGGKTYLVSYVNDELETALDKISFYEAIPVEQLKKDIGGIGR